MTPQTRALIEAAEEAKQILNDAGNSNYSESIMEAMNVLAAAIASAKAAEEEAEDEVTTLKVENDRLQTSNAALRRRLEGIADQYAVDCL